MTFNQIKDLNIINPKFRILNLEELLNINK